jgi:ribonuclease P protein component
MTSRYFVAFYLREEAAAAYSKPARFGFTLPRALGSAVVRNRIKRRMREAVRANVSLAPSGCTFVFNPRRAALTAPFTDLCRETGRLFSRCSSSV